MNLLLQTKSVTPCNGHTWLSYFCHQGMKGAQLSQFTTGWGENQTHTGCRNCVVLLKQESVKGHTLIFQESKSVLCLICPKHTQFFLLAIQSCPPPCRVTESQIRLRPSQIEEAFLLPICFHGHFHYAVCTIRYVSSIIFASICCSSLKQYTLYS